MGLVAELHDFMRFDSPRGLMAFLGLVPSEFSSADSQRRGAITKAGNKHARRLLIEASWHYRHKPNSASLKRRRQGQPVQVIALADKAMYRLNRRFNRMLAKGKPRPKIVVAIARELAGFVWAALHPKAA
jgi:transposase